MILKTYFKIAVENFFEKKKIQSVDHRIFAAVKSLVETRTAAYKIQPACLNTKPGDMPDRVDREYWSFKDVVLDRLKEKGWPFVTDLGPLIDSKMPQEKIQQAVDKSNALNQFMYGLLLEDEVDEVNTRLALDDPKPEERPVVSFIRSHVADLEDVAKQLKDSFSIEDIQHSRHIILAGEPADSQPKLVL